MPAITFDILNYEQELKKAGFTDEQAQIQAKALALIIENNLATKRDLKELELTLKRDIKELEYRMIIKLGTINALMAGIVVALVKLI